MNDVLEQAKRLAAMMAAHVRTLALRDATREVTADPDAKRLEEDYAQAAEEMREREIAGAPIEPELKRRILDLGERIRRSPPLQRLLRANAEFGELMDAVQQEISAAVGEALAPVEGGGAPRDASGQAPAAEDATKASGKEPEPPRSSILWTP